MDRSNNILAGTGRGKHALVGFVKTQRLKMMPQPFLECSFTCRSALTALPFFPIIPVFRASFPIHHYFIKCGVARLINSRVVIALVFFQNLGKCL